MTQQSNKTTVREGGNVSNPFNNRPKSGLPSDPSTSINLPGGGSITSDPTKNNGITKSYTDEEIQSRRVGDWYFDDRGFSHVVPGSETDIARKWTAINGMSPMRSNSIRDWESIIAAAGTKAVTGAALGSKLGGYGSIVGGVGGALVGGLSEMMDKDREHLNDFLNQEITVTRAYTITKNPDGTRSYKIDPEAAAMAGYGSSPNIRKLSKDVESTGAYIGEDGKLNITVTPLYAMSGEYIDFKKSLDELFPNGISEEQARQIVNEDTGTTFQEYLNTAVRASEIKYYYLASSIEAFKRIAPGASEETLAEACKTQAIGAYTKDEMNGVEIQTYDLQNNKKAVNAKDFFDEISSMSDSDRAAYITEVNNKIEAEETNDNEKAILYAQAQALYAASMKEKGDYAGMFERGFFDPIFDTRTLGGTRIGDTPIGSLLDVIPSLNTKELEGFYSNPWSEALAGAVDIGFQIGREVLLYKAARGAAGKALGIAGNIAGDTALGTLLSNADIISRGAGAAIGVGKTEAETVRLIYDAATAFAKSGITAADYKLLGGDYDFESNFDRELFWTILLSRGPEEFTHYLEGDTVVWEPVRNRRGVTPEEEANALVGEVVGEGNSTLNAKRASSSAKTKKAEVVSESFRDDLTAEDFDAYTTSNPGVALGSSNLVDGKVVASAPNSPEKLVYENETVGEARSRLVKKTAQDVSRKRASFFTNKYNNKVAIKVQEMFYNENAMISEGFNRIVELTGDKNFAKTAIEAGNDVRKQTNRQLDRLHQRPGFKAASEASSRKRLELTGGNPKKFTKADSDYLKAKAERHRFIKEAGDDKSAKMKAVEKYKEPLNAIKDKNRKKLLDEYLDLLVAEGDELEKWQVDTGWHSQDLANKLKNSNDKYVPLWPAKTAKRGGFFSRDRRDLREFKNKNIMYEIDSIADVTESSVKQRRAVAQNIARNEAAKQIVQEASVPGNQHIWVVSDTVIDDGGVDPAKTQAVESIETEVLRKYSSDFEKECAKIEKDVRRKVPTEKAWREDNNKAIRKSAAFNGARKISSLRKELIDAYKEVAKVRQAIESALPTTSDAVIDAMFEDLGFWENRANTISLAEDEAVSTFVSDLEKLLRQQMEKHSYSPVQIDLDSYLDAVNSDAIRIANQSFDNVEGELVTLINKAVETVNPYDLTPEQVVTKRIEKAATRARKKMAADAELQRRISRETTLAGKINAKADAVYDVASLIAGRVMNKIKESLNIAESGDEVLDPTNDDNFFKFNSGRPSNVIDYRVDGQTHRVKFGGPLAEIIPREFYRKDFTLPGDLPAAIAIPMKATGAIAKGVGQLKRSTLSSLDPTRAAVNLKRDLSRASIASAGRIYWEEKTMKTQAYAAYDYTSEAKKAIDDGWELAMRSQGQNTYNRVYSAKKNDTLKAILKADKENALDDDYFTLKNERSDMPFIKKMATTTRYLKTAFVHYKLSFEQKDWVEKLSLLTDSAENLTRRRSMMSAYYRGISEASQKGLPLEEAVEYALREAYFYGDEATTNFSRRGSVVKVISTFVPYLSQNFSSMKSAEYVYVDNPIAVERGLKIMLGGYSFLLALTLQNEESRKRYFLLDEATRNSSIIIPLDNGAIITIQVDEELAKAISPTRRFIETLNGVDPQAFNLWALGMDVFDAINPLDMSGFSEGDKFNIERGFQKLGSQILPPLVLAGMQNRYGKNFYYGTDISVDDEYTSYLGIYDPTPGQLTKKSKNSKTMADISNVLGIPQWKIQNIYETFGGSGTVGKLVLYTLDKLRGATEEETGGKTWANSVFKAFGANDETAAENALWSGINQLNKEKAKLQKQIKQIEEDMQSAVGEDKANLINRRREIIREYGMHVSEFLDQYLSAYEITGGLSRDEASRVFYLYDIYGDSSNADMYSDGYLEKYYNQLAEDRATRRITALAAESDFDKYVNPYTKPYHETYGYTALKNSVYGKGMDTMAKIATFLENDEDYDNSYKKLKSDVNTKLWQASQNSDYDTYDAIAYEYDLIILKAVLPYLEEAGLEESLDNSAVMDYLSDWIYVPSDYKKTAKGRWVPKLPKGTRINDAFKPYFIKLMYGIVEE